MLLSTGQHHRPQIRRFRKLLQDMLPLRLVDHGADGGGLIQPTAQDEPLGLLHQQGLELLRHRLHHVDPLGGDADLAGVPEAVEGSELRRVLQLRVVQDDHRVLPAELQDHALQATGCGLEDVLADFARAGKGDQVNLRRHQGLALFVGAMHHLEDALRQALAQDVRIRLARERRLLRRLEDDGVSGDQGGQHHPVGHRHGEVPRRDGGAHAEGIVVNHRAEPTVLYYLRLHRLHHLVQLVSDLGADASHLGDTVLDGFAHLPGDDRSQALGLGAEAVDYRAKKLRPSGGAHLGPGILGGAGHLDYRRDVLDRCDGDFTDHVTGGGVV